MFGFGKKKKKDEDKKKKSKIDKLIMGAIVGGAVGSVIGMSIAPQKGKDTREMIAQKGKNIMKKGHEIGEKISADAKEKREAKEHPEENDETVSEADQHKKNLLSKVKDRLFGRSKKVKKNMMKEGSESDMKKIPNEVE